LTLALHPSNGIYQAPRKTSSFRAGMDSGEEDVNDAFFRGNLKAQQRNSASEGGAGLLPAPRRILDSREPCGVDESGHAIFAHKLHAQLRSMEASRLLPDELLFFPFFRRSAEI